MALIQAAQRRGAHSVEIAAPPIVLATASIAGDMEGEGRFGDEFDKILEDDLWGEESWEKAESKMLEQTVRLALAKASLHEDQIDVLLGGDLLNQIIASNYAARQLGIPFFGLYGACSTMSESLLLGAMLVGGGFFTTAACAVSSHFSSAERQYRNPLELGNQRPLSAQRTVTGSGATILGAFSDPPSPHIAVVGGTVGRVIDMGIDDVNNMGAAMAPAASDTIVQHFQDMNRSVDDYDLIITGDLGKYGQMHATELLAEQNIYVEGKFFDCGERMFKEAQDAHAGGSGCGCSAITLNSHIVNRMMAGQYHRVLFMATGALMSPGIAQQGETIPGVAHAVILERRGA